MTTPEQIALDAEYEKFARAMFLDSLPSNPRPFAKALQDYWLKDGEITSGTSQAILWMILAILHGQMADICITDPVIPFPTSRTKCLDTLNRMIGTEPSPDYDWEKVWMVFAHDLAQWAWPDSKRLGLPEEWNRLNRYFNPEKKDEKKGGYVVVSFLIGTRKLNQFARNAGLGLTGIGARKEIRIDYAPGLFIDMLRVRSSMDYVKRTLDETKDEQEILSYEVISIHNETD